MISAVILQHKNVDDNIFKHCGVEIHKYWGSSFTLQSSAFREQSSTNVNSSVMGLTWHVWIGRTWYSLDTCSITLNPNRVGRVETTCLLFPGCCCGIECSQMHVLLWGRSKSFYSLQIQPHMLGKGFGRPWWVPSYTFWFFVCLFLLPVYSKDRPLAKV